MKTKITTLLLLLTIAIQAQTLTSWAKMAPLGDNFSNRQDASMVAYNNELYIFGGYTGIGGGKDFVKYNLSSGKITNLKSFDYNVANPTEQGIFEVGGKFYLIYGSSLKVYDPVTGNWTTTPIDSSFLSTRIGGGFVIGTNIYFINESSGMIAYNTLTKTFSQKANKPVANVRGFFTFSIGNKGYLGGGTAYPTNGSVSRADFYEYDSVNNNWTIKAQLPTGAEFGTGVSVNGKGYAGFGNTYGNNVTTGSLKWYEYNPVTNLWVEKADGSNGGYRSVTTSVGTDIYRYGGAGIPATGNYFNPFNGILRKYNTVNNQWTIVGKLGHNREQTAGTYSNGKIYVVGGMDGYGILPNDIFEYNISANNWQKKADYMPAQNQYNARNLAVLNNKLYLVGGYDPHKGSGDLYSNAVFEYDLITSTWARKNNYPLIAGNIFTTVYNNELFAFGGMFNGADFYSNTYKYNQTSDSWTSLASAPIGISQYNGSFCAIGDYVYNFSYRNSYINIYRYSFSNNSWVNLTFNNSNVGAGGASAISSKIFTYNNKIYILTDSVIKEFNTTTNQFTDVDSFLNVPFSANYQTVVSAPDGVYFGFGNRIEYPSRGISNSFTKLRFNAGVATDYGIYKTGFYDDELGDENYNPVCNLGSNLVGLNSNGSLYDFKGNLFSSIINAQSGQVEGVCMNVESRDLAAAYYTNVENNKRKTYLNKSFSISTKTSNAKVRFYFTAQELQTFVNQYNTLYGVSKTINDIKIVSFSNYPSMGDFNPLNNTGINNKNITFTIHDYGTDKYFETTDALNHGELHLYLESDVLAVDEAKNKSLNIYPNPVKDILYIQTNGENVKTITVYDVSGKQIFTSKAAKEINVSKLQKGAYIVTLETDKEVKTFKMIKN